MHAHMHIKPVHNYLEPATYLQWQAF